MDNTPNRRPACALERICALLCLVMCVAWVGCRHGDNASSSSAPEASAASCPGGKVMTSGDRCCWRSQLATSDGDRCIGRPSCPPRLVPSGDECVEPQSILGDFDRPPDCTEAPADCELYAHALTSRMTSFDAEASQTLLDFCRQDHVVYACLAGASKLLTHAPDAQTYANRRDYWGTRRNFLVSNRRQGGDFSLNMLGSVLDDHLIGQADRPAWLQLEGLQDACERKSVEACIARASLLAKAGFEGDQTEDACSALEVACAEGAPGACRTRLMIDVPACEPVPDGVVAELWEQCESTPRYACSVLLKPDGGPAEQKKVRKLAGRMCDLGYPSGCSWVARALEQQAIDGDVARTEVLDAYRRACDVSGERDSQPCARAMMIAIELGQRTDVTFPVLSQCGHGDFAMCRSLVAANRKYDLDVPDGVDILEVSKRACAEYAEAQADVQWCGALFDP